VLERSLSPVAKNVVIVVRGGVVTLRGEVSREDERAQVRALAMEVHGIGRVDDALTVKRGE